MRYCYRAMVTLLAFSLLTACASKDIPLKPNKERLTDDMVLDVNSFLKLPAFSTGGIVYIAEDGRSFFYINANVENEQDFDLYLNPLEFYVMDGEEKIYPTGANYYLCNAKYDDSNLKISSGEKNKVSIAFYLETKSKLPNYLYFRDKKVKVEFLNKQEIK